MGSQRTSDRERLLRLIGVVLRSESLRIWMIVSEASHDLSENSIGLDHAARLLADPGLEDEPWSKQNMASA